MNKKIFENARFCPKGDIEANWNKAVGFIPLDKEIIIYKPDEKHKVARIKVGDGVTSVQDLPFVTDMDDLASKEWVTEAFETAGISIKQYVDNAVSALPQADWNQNDEIAKDYIKNRPFYEMDNSIPSKTYTFDGNLEGRHYKLLENGAYLVKISDDIITDRNILVGARMTIANDREETSLVMPDGMVLEASGGFVLAEAAILLIFDAQAFGSNGAIFESLENGIYSILVVNNNEPVAYIKEFVTATIEKKQLKQLDEKFIPDTIARVKDLDTATKDNILSIFN